MLGKDEFRAFRPTPGSRSLPSAIAKARTSSSVTTAGRPKRLLQLERGHARFPRESASPERPLWSPSATNRGVPGSFRNRRERFGLPTDGPPTGWLHPQRAAAAGS